MDANRFNAEYQTFQRELERRYINWLDKQLRNEEDQNTMLLQDTQPIEQQVTQQNQGQPPQPQQLPQDAKMIQEGAGKFTDVINKFKNLYKDAGKKFLAMYGINADRQSGQTELPFVIKGKGKKEQAKYERCVMDVKAKTGYKEGEKNVVNPWAICHASVKGEEQSGGANNFTKIMKI